jgi:hypothetical protein
VDKTKECRVNGFALSLIHTRSKRRGIVVVDKEDWGTEGKNDYLAQGIGQPT